MPLSGDGEAGRLRAELAIEAAGIGSYDYDLVTGRLRWDARLIELFGYERAGFAETIEAFFARVHPSDLQRTADGMQEAIARQGDLQLEYRVVLPSGDTRWVQARGRVLTDERGTAVRMIGVAYDTTAQHDADARVARVLETMPTAFFALDRNWRFSYVNVEAERLLGHTRDELIGGNIWTLFPAAVGSPFEEHYRGAAASGRHRSFEAYYPPPLDAWYEVRAWPTPDGLSVYFNEITERRLAEQRARRSAALLTLVARAASEVSAALTDGLGEDEAVRRLTRVVVPDLGDWMIASLVGEDGRLHDVAGWHADPARRDLVTRYAELRLGALNSTAPIVEALESGEAMRVADVPAAVGRTLPRGEVSDVFWDLAPQTAVALALRARGRTVGALSMYRSADRGPADDEDVATLRQVADRVALALDNARLHERQRRLAEALQRSMLTAPPEPDHAEIVVRYRPALEAAQVGGDWYDAFLQPDGATVLVIGDVVGHDVAAAAAMGQLRGVLRGIAYRDGLGPAEILTELDRAVVGLEMGAMATAAVARIEQTPEERAAGVTRLRWSNAGHPPPLLLHPDGRIEQLVAERTELMLGVDPGTTRSDGVVRFRRGATVLLYTDGLVEGRQLELDDGIAALRSALAELAHLPLERLCDELLERLRPEGPEDDVALVAIRLHPQDRPRPAEAGPAHVPPLAPPEEGSAPR